MPNFYTHVAVQKNNILLRGVENGERVQKKVPYNPYLFIKKDCQSEFRTLDGEPVFKKTFASMSDARNYMKEMEGVSNVSIYGLTNFTYTYIFDSYKGEIRHDRSLLSIISIDIEVDVTGDKAAALDVLQASKEITLITVSKKGKKYVFGCKDYENTRKDVEYFKCKTEFHMLRVFLRFWRRLDPDIVTGWNIEQYDIPYIVNRILRVLGEQAAKELSPWGMLNDTKITTMSGDMTVRFPLGVAILDYMVMYKKFGYSVQERYTLDHVCFVELGEKKLDYGEYGSLEGLQTKNWQTYVDYNIRDVDLVDMLDDKRKLLDLVIAMAYDAKINFQDTFTTVRPWDIIIHNYLLERNIVIPQNEKHHGREFVGGYVKEPIIGMHEWVASFDLNSLYPHIIIQYNISPETYRGRFPASYDITDVLNGALSKLDHREYLESNNVAVTANMLTFTREKQGFLPSLMQKYYNDRVIFNDKMSEAEKELESLSDTKENKDRREQLVKDIARYNSLQMAKKIQLNSAYGALGNEYFRWFEVDFAEAITTSGQLTTRWIERHLNDLMNKVNKTENTDYIIACDTDSVYMLMGGFMKEYNGPDDIPAKITFLDKVCDKVIQPFIDKKYNDLCNYMNGYSQKMRMKRECIANKAIWSAAKHYILNVYNNKGVIYAKPKLKMMGIEAVRSSTPQVCRDAIKKALEIIMNDTEQALQAFAKEFYNEFCKMDFEQVAFPRSANNLDKYTNQYTIWGPKCPIAVKGALIFNHHLKQSKLEDKYQPIASGEKVRFSYFRTPNPLKANVLSCVGPLPKEFGMDKYIDRETQYDKSFGEPFTKILNAIGWSLKPKASLHGLFED